jgi:hypothetical protein
MQKIYWARAIIIALLLSSCSAQWHLKKACKKDPAICQPQVVKFDTIIYTDSVEIFETFYTEVSDTIVIDTGSVIVKIIRDHDIIRTYVKQKPDTIKVSKTITLPPRISVKECDYPWWLVIVSIVLFLLIVLRK